MTHPFAVFAHSDHSSYLPVSTTHLLPFLHSIIRVSFQMQDIHILPIYMPIYILGLDKFIFRKSRPVRVRTRPTYLQSAIRCIPLARTVITEELLVLTFLTFLIINVCAISYNSILVPYLRIYQIFPVCLFSSFQIMRLLIYNTSREFSGAVTSHNAS